MEKTVVKIQHRDGLVEKPRVDLVLFSYSDDGLQVLLRRREDGQYPGLWGLPGGVIDTNKDNTLDDTVNRVSQRILGRRLPNVYQAFTLGSMKRDPRLEWSMTVVHFSYVRPDFMDGSDMDIQYLRWWNTESIVPDSQLFLDHADLVKQATVVAMRNFRFLMEEMQFPIGLLPDEFTMGELHSMCQFFSSRKIDPLTFKRRLDAAGCTVPLNGKFRAGGAHRPAQLFKIVNQPINRE